MRFGKWVGLLFFLFLISGGLKSQETADSSALRVVETNPVLSQEAKTVISLWNNGEKKAAYKRARHLRKDYKKDPLSWVVSAAMYCGDQKYKKCLKFANKALKFGPQSAEAYYYRGVAYEGLKRYLDSANEFKAALLARENFDFAQQRLDHVLVRLGGTGREEAEEKPDD